MQISEAAIKDYYDKKRTEWEQQGVNPIPSIEDSRADIEKILTQQRVDRALERLHRLLSKRGITSARSVLAAALVAGALVTAPAGLAATITTTAMTAPVAAAAMATKFGLLKPALTTKPCMLVGTAGLFALGTIGTIHFVRTHQDLMLRLHQWFMQ